jgi:hypothetical protein
MGQIGHFMGNRDRLICFFIFLKLGLGKCVIETMPVVSSVCFHSGDKTHKSDVYVNLRCSGVSSLGDCGVNLVGPIRISSECPMSVDCLRELGRLIQRDHDPTCVTVTQELQTSEKDVADSSTKRPVDEGGVSRNANDVLMLRVNLKSK